MVHPPTSPPPAPNLASLISLSAPPPKAGAEAKAEGKKGKSKAKATAAKAKGKSAAGPSLHARSKEAREKYSAYRESRKDDPSFAHLTPQQKTAAIAEEWRRRPGWVCTKCKGKGCKRCEWKPTAAARLPPASAEPGSGTAA